MSDLKLVLFSFPHIQWALDLSLPFSDPLYCAVDLTISFYMFTGGFRTRTETCLRSNRSPSATSTSLAGDSWMQSTSWQCSTTGRGGAITHQNMVFYYSTLCSHSPTNFLLLLQVPSSPPSLRTGVWCKSSSTLCRKSKLKLQASLVSALEHSSQSSLKLLRATISPSPPRTSSSRQQTSGLITLPCLTSPKHTSPLMNEL